MRGVKEDLACKPYDQNRDQVKRVQVKNDECGGNNTPCLQYYSAVQYSTVISAHLLNSLKANASFMQSIYSLLDYITTT